MRLLGLDPGLRATGWGVVLADGSRLSHVAHGVIVPPPGPVAGRLAALAAGIEEVIAAHRPQEAAVEETFVNANPASALKLGQARGIALLVPARAGLPVGEYAATTVKKALTGGGHAGKQQVALMVAMLFPGVAARADAADALAVAICHAHRRTAPGRRMPVRADA